ncbi:MAG: V-type ATPase subunit [Clostridiales bacterium]|nr:V-type ATPase subunit [Clostridiales bacterium]
MTASTIIFANTLAMQYASRLDGERLRRIVEAPTVDAALKMLGDYGYTYAPNGSIDNFIVAETDRLIDFINETVPNDRAREALIAPFWYNNVKLAYKSRFIAVPDDGYYQVGGEPSKIARGDYSDCDRSLEEALTALDEAGEKEPREIDLAITRAMYKLILSCGIRVIKKYFKTEIDLKNMLTAARLRRLGICRDEFIDGGTLKKSDLMESLTVKNFYGCFFGTEYEDAAEELESDGFKSLAKFESDADDHLFFLTDSLCAKISTYEPFLNYYTRARVELKAIKTALVCLKTDARDVFFARMPKIYE